MIKAAFGISPNVLSLLVEFDLLWGLLLTRLSDIRGLDQLIFLSAFSLLFFLDFLKMELKH